MDVQAGSAGHPMESDGKSQGGLFGELPRECSLRFPIVSYMMLLQNQREHIFLKYGRFPTQNPSYFKEKGVQAGPVESNGKSQGAPPESVP